MPAVRIRAVWCSALLVAGTLSASPAWAGSGSPRERDRDQQTRQEAPVDHQVVESPGRARPWNIDVDLMGGILGIPAPANRALFTPDNYVGIRAAGGYSLSRLRLGGELAWRSTAVGHTGGAPGVGAALLAPFTMQTVRQSNQLALGGMAGLDLGRLDFMLEPLVMMGLSTSMRTLFVLLPNNLPQPRGYPTFGGYLGAGFITGLRPLFLRMDLLSSLEAGPPPFTSRVLQVQYNLSAGLRF